MRSPEDRLDAMIDDVAREMTAAPHGDLAADFAARIAMRRRLSRRILVPALAAAVVILAVATMIELRAPAPVPAPTTATVIAIPQARSPVTGSQSSVDRSAADQPAVGSGRSPVVRHVVHRAPRRLPLDPPFETDLSPALLRVDAVHVAPIAVAAEPAPPPIEIVPIEVTPLEPRGGSR